MTTKTINGAAGTIKTVREVISTIFGDEYTANQQFYVNKRETCDSNVKIHFAKWNQIMCDTVFKLLQTYPETQHVTSVRNVGFMRNAELRDSSVYITFSNK